MGLLQVDYHAVVCMLHFGLAVAQIVEHLLGQVEFLLQVVVVVHRIMVGNDPLLWLGQVDQGTGIRYR